jgi:hypothetical protein
VQSCADFASLLLQIVFEFKWFVDLKGEDWFLSVVLAADVVFYTLRTMYLHDLVINDSESCQKNACVYAARSHCVWAEFGNPEQYSFLVSVVPRRT